MVLLCALLVSAASSGLAADEDYRAGVDAPGMLLGELIADAPSPDIVRGRAWLGDRIEWPMYDDPALPVPPTIRTYPVELSKLWVLALGRPEARLRISAAEAIDRAHRTGMPNLLQEPAGTLIGLLTKPDPHPAVKLTAIAALIAMDASRSAEAMLARNQADGLETILLTDPALARWDYQPARQVWLDRLQDPGTSRQVRRSAIEALGTVRESRAREALRTVAWDGSADSALRLAAARALGEVVSEGLVDDARSLAGGGTAALPDRIMAAAMLATHSSRDARELLLEMTKDEEPAVAGIALRRLLEIDPMLLESQVERLCKSPDAGLRALAVRVLSAPATPDAVRLLADMLDDSHEDIRVAARKQMRSYDKNPNLTRAVRDNAMRVLAGDRWRGRVEAADLLGRLDHKAAAPRLLELLRFERDEVQLVAAVNLRRLAVAETMRPLLEHCQELALLWQGQAPVVRMMPGRGPAQPAQPAPTVSADPGLHLRLRIAAAVMAQAFQAFGALDYQPAEPLMRKLFPRKANGGIYEEASDMRGAATWALSRLHRGERDEALEEECVARLNDMHPFDSEAALVRHMSAVCLARLELTKPEARLGTLRRWSEPGLDGGDSAILACRWAIKELTGEPMVPFKAQLVGTGGWYLEPVQAAPPPTVNPADPSE